MAPLRTLIYTSGERFGPSCFIYPMIPINSLTIVARPLTLIDVIQDACRLLVSNESNMCNINGRDVQTKNVVNNVDMSCLGAP